MGHLTSSHNAVLDKYIESKMRSAGRVTASTHTECLALLEAVVRCLDERGSLIRRRTGSVTN